MTAMIGDSFRAPGKGKRLARSAAEQTSGEIGDICTRRGWPRPTSWRAPCSRLSLMARGPIGSGWRRRSCWGRSRATRSATRRPPSAPCSTPSISPDLNRSCPRSSATRAYEASSWVNRPGASPCVARHLPLMAPCLAPRNFVAIANVRANEHSIGRTGTTMVVPANQRRPVVCILRSPIRLSTAGIHCQTSERTTMSRLSKWIN